jgi:ATP-dependent exoDNAse (exonuclease V) alpha subunit
VQGRIHEQRIDVDVSGARPIRAADVAVVCDENASVVEAHVGDVVPKDVVYCDFGYVITCHKSQGSEWDNVLVWDEYVPPQLWDMKRWRYTAITRAAKNLTYLI